MNFKNRTLTTALLLLMVFTMLLSAVSCNQTTGENSTENTTAQKTEATEAVTATLTETEAAETEKATEATETESAKAETTEAKAETTEAKAETTEAKADTTEAKVETTEAKVETTEKETETETEAPDPSKLPSQEVKVLSQNVLCDENTISRRATAMANSILAIMPDSFGVQECTKTWTKHLDIDLKAYNRVGVDCMGNDLGEFSTYIYYLKDKYRVIDSSTFWMSNTPDVPSQFNDHVNVMNRTCTWAILENKTTGFRYVHVNCHLDWADASANLVQIQMIRDLILRFEEMGYPVFATGDFNSKEGTDSYKAMLSASSIADTRYVANKTTDVVSHYGNKGSVDFCFVTKNKMQVLEFDIIHNVRDGVEVSDHNGVYAYAVVQSLPIQDHSKTAVAFPEDAKINAVKDPRYGALMSVTFDQAKTLEGSVASSYEVVIRYENGTEFYSDTVYGSQYCIVQPTTVNFKLSDGISGHTYTIEITPVSIFGEKGEPITSTMEWVADPNAPEPPPAPDVVDISVKDGKVIDSTENNIEITQLDTVSVTADAMVFNKEGIVRTSSLAGLYGKMIDGFTMEAVVTTTKELNPMAHFASNLHAGGFGLYTHQGLLHFRLHNGKEYISVTYSVEANTTYHVVGKFDGKNLVLYINGEKVNSVVLGGAMKLPTVAGAEFLCIGGDADAKGVGENRSQCTVYRVGIYSAVLSDSEIKALSMIE